MEKAIDIVCAHCGATFQKIAREYRRQLKKGNTRFFCSLRCTAFTRNKEHPPKGNPKSLIPGNRRDEYTSFKWFIRHSVRRNNLRNEPRAFNITEKYLKEIWEQQSGICPFTGWNLVLPHDANGNEESKSLPLHIKFRLHH